MFLYSSWMACLCFCPVCAFLLCLSSARRCLTSLWVNSLTFGSCISEWALVGSEFSLALLKVSWELLSHFSGKQICFQALLQSKCPLLSRNWNIWDISSLKKDILGWKRNQRWTEIWTQNYSMYFQCESYGWNASLAQLCCLFSSANRAEMYVFTCKEYCVFSSFSLLIL